MTFIFQPYLEFLEANEVHKKLSHKKIINEKSKKKHLISNLILNKVGKI